MPFEIWRSKKVPPRSIKSVYLVLLLIVEWVCFTSQLKPIWILIVACSYLVYFKDLVHYNYRHWALWALVFFAYAAIRETLTHGGPLITDRPLQVFLAFVFSLPIVAYVSREFNVRLILHALVIAGVVASAVVYFSYFTGVGAWVVNSENTRYGGIITGEHPNIAAFYLLISLVAGMTLFFVYYEKYYLLLSISILPALVLTGSRKVLLAFVIVLIMMTLRFVVITRLYASFIALFTFSLCLIYASLNSGISPTARIVEFSIDDSVSERFMLLNLAVESYWEWPIFGGGSEAFRGLNTQGLYTHNNYLELLNSYGFVGFVLYYSIFIYCFLFCRFWRNLSVVALGAILTAMLLVEFWQVTYFLKPSFLIVGIFLSIPELRKSPSDHD